MTRQLVAISSHDPQWAERAAVLIATLYGALGARALRIDHIGSTAVPGIDAKDVLDIQVSVTDLSDAQGRFDQPLRALGFVGFPIGRDHVPAGRMMTLPYGPSNSGRAGAAVRMPTFTSG